MANTANASSSRKVLSTMGLAALATFSSYSLAYEAGDVVIRGGVAIVEPNESSSTIFINNPALGDTGVGNIKVGTDTQLGVTASYMLTSSLALELLAATPFDHDISLPALNEKIASTKHLPPTVTLNWHLNEPSEKFQPYIGVGFNYTVFFDEKVTPALDSDAAFTALSQAAGGPAITGVTGTKIDLDDSFGLAVHAGFDYMLTEDLGLNFSYYRIELQTDATITTNSGNAGPIEATAKVNIDPSVYMAGISYRF